jgi:hypothetical protein
MGGVPFSREKINARETALSSDENRSYQLWSRELQNVLAAGSADPVGVPFSCALSALALTFTSGFQMALADGDAFFYFPTDPSLTVDDSPFEVLRWRSVPALSFATPDGTNPRIDLVVAQPASADTDLVSRNILVDPSTRTIAAQSVFKTSGPAAIITVVTGTPAGTPVPPAVPSGKCALFEVLVPAAAPTASSFGPCPRLSRRAEFPWSRMSGILSGCRLTWDCTVDPTTTSSGLTMTGPSSLVLIDGEILDASALFGVPVSQDTANNPFSIAAGATDKPYYIYLCGGRHAPQGTALSGGGMAPVAVVESLVAPNNLGQPSSAITTPRGTTTISGAVYIGIGFVRAGTTRRHACVMSEDMTYILGAAENTSLTKTITGAESFGVPGSKPAVSTRAFIDVGVSAVSTSATAILALDRGDGGGVPLSLGSPTLVNALCFVKNNSSGSNARTAPFFFNPANATVWQTGQGLAAGDVVTMSIQAYDHGVTKLSGIVR